MNLHDKEQRLEPFQFAQLLVTIGEMPVTSTTKTILDRLVSIFLADKAILQKPENWESLSLYYLLIAADVAPISNLVFTGARPLSSGRRSRRGIG